MFFEGNWRLFFIEFQIHTNSHNLSKRIVVWHFIDFLLNRPLCGDFVDIWQFPCAIFTILVCLLLSVDIHGIHDPRIVSVLLGEFMSFTLSCINQSSVTNCRHKTPFFLTKTIPVNFLIPLLLSVFLCFSFLHSFFIRFSKTAD